MFMQVGREERRGIGRKRQRKGKAETRTMSKLSDWNRTKMGAGWNRGRGQQRGGNQEKSQVRRNRYRRHLT